jgi:hypothetical protein
VEEGEVMLLADWFGNLLGNACLFSVVIIGTVCWAIGRLVESAGNVLQNEDVREAARIGFWSWFLSDDDE